MFDFPRFAADHGVPSLTEGHHHCHAGWVQTHCPLCTDGRWGWHLGWSEERGNLNCWRCGRVRVLDYLRAVLRAGPDRAGATAAQYGRMDPPTSPARGPAGPQGPPAPTPPGLGPLGPAHVQYLRGRGFYRVQDLARTWDLQGAGRLSGQWSWRVVAPVRDRAGTTVAWVGRTISAAGHPKYKLTEEAACGCDPRALLYGAHLARGDAVIIVEGPADAWRVGPGAVATLGHGWHQEQAQQLRQWRRRYVVYDPDEPAQRDARRLAEWLAPFPGETELVSGLGRDPGSMSRQDVEDLRSELNVEGGAVWTR